MTVRTGFRTDYRTDMAARLVDLGCHLLAAWILPGPWALQFLPDVMLPVLWTWSMLTDRYASDDSIPLVLHRMFHLRSHRTAPLLHLLALLLVGIAHPFLAAHWLAHVAIDGVTHEEGWLS